jgi:hypothetical protein
MIRGRYLGGILPKWGVTYTIGRQELLAPIDEFAHFGLYLLFNLDFKLLAGFAVRHTI